jgi:hypothetical protein
MRRLMPCAAALVAILLLLDFPVARAQDYYRNITAPVVPSLTVTGTTTTTYLAVVAGGQIYWQGQAVMSSPANGEIVMSNYAATIGSTLKFDSLPTFVSGGGATTPAVVVAGSTALFGAVNVGTGVVTSPIVVNFNGAAFPSAPFCQISQTAGTFSTYTASTTQLTIAAAVVWPASTVVSWVCASAK